MTKVHTYRLFVDASITFFCCVLPSKNTIHITDGDFNLHYPCPAVSN